MAAELGRITILETPLPLAMGLYVFDFAGEQATRNVH